MYQLTHGPTILRLNPDGSTTSIPPDPANADYQEYLIWDSVAGNDPLPADPLPVEYIATRAVSSVVRTTDDVPLEVFRYTTEAKHVYAASFRMTAVDAGNGTTKRARAEMTFKGLASSVTQVGATVASTPMQDTGASTWAIQPSVSGKDLIISVKGAVGRTIDWTLAGDIEVFAPEGLA